MCLCSILAFLGSGFLQALVLSGETQERERILYQFSKRFHYCNPGAFPSVGMEGGWRRAGEGPGVGMETACVSTGFFEQPMPESIGATEKWGEGFTPGVVQISLSFVLASLWGRFCTHLDLCNYAP